MLILRPVAEGDLDDLVGLAKQLDSMNLPADPEFLVGRIALSGRSFRAARGEDSLDWREAVYMFALEALETKRTIGTSLDHGQARATGAPLLLARRLDRGAPQPRARQALPAQEAAPADLNR